MGPPLTEQQQQPANASVTSSAPAERERAAAKFSLGADCPHESHFTLHPSYYVCCRLLCLYKAGKREAAFFFFFGSLRLWLSLLSTHTQISRVAVTESGISKSSLHLPMAAFSHFNTHTQAGSRAAIITSVTAVLLHNTEKIVQLFERQTLHIYPLCNLTLLKSRHLIDFCSKCASHQS